MPALEGKLTWDQEVEKCMCRNCVSISGQAKIFEVLDRMIENQVSSLVVEPRWPGEDYGIVTHKDIVQAASESDFPWEEFSKKEIYEIASRPTAVVSPKQKLKEAYVLLEKNPLRCVPVVAEDHVVGIVSDADIVDLP